MSRLRRLQSEVAQLERELQNTPAVVGTSNLPRVNQRKSVLPARQPVDIVSELSSLRERLNAASDHAQASSDDKDGFSTRLRQLEEVSLGEKAPALPPSTTSQSGQVGDVDKRLAILERAVGVADTESDVSTLCKHVLIGSAEPDFAFRHISSPRSFHECPHPASPSRLHRSTCQGTPYRPRSCRCFTPTRSSKLAWARRECNSFPYRPRASSVTLRTPSPPGSLAASHPTSPHRTPQSIDTSRGVHQHRRGPS